MTQQTPSLQTTLFSTDSAPIREVAIAPLIPSPWRHIRPSSDRHVRTVATALSGGQTRPITVHALGPEQFGILDGHDVVAAARMLGWAHLQAHIVDASALSDEIRWMLTAHAGVKRRPRPGALILWIPRILAAAEGAIRQTDLTAWLGYRTAASVSDYNAIGSHFTDDVLDRAGIDLERDALAISRVSRTEYRWAATAAEAEDRAIRLALVVLRSAPEWAADEQVDQNRPEERPIAEIRELTPRGAREHIRVLATAVSGEMTIAEIDTHIAEYRETLLRHR